MLFTTMMATFMILIMSNYNMLLHSGGQIGFAGWQNFFAELFFSMPMALLVAGKLAPIIAFKLLGRRASHIALGITITFFIAAIMVPIMSLFVLVRKVGIDHLTWTLYGKAIFYNFIVAFPVQVLFLGHFVRKLFRQSIGIKYKCRASLNVFNPYLKNSNVILATKAALITNAVVICICSI